MHRLRALHLLLVLPAFVLGVAASAGGETIRWRSDVILYGDNTEFSGPYRVGETIFGGQLASELHLDFGAGTELLAGLFADRRHQSDGGFDDVLPLLSFRHRDGANLWVLGSLRTEARHGLLDLLQQDTYEVTRPIEYGLQTIRDSGAIRWDLFLAWQKLNTPEHREVFDYGGSASAAIGKGFAVEAKLHGVHHGGQLYGEGEVWNNTAGGLGLSASGALGPLPDARLAIFVLGSRTSLGETRLVRRAGGSGFLVEARAKLSEAFELRALGWRGSDFFAEEGNFNYGSLGGPRDADWYRKDRDYAEAGLRWTKPLEAGIVFSADLKYHLVDSKAGYSYRFVARVPFEMGIR
jgi:hypothetical protein